jgi:hypothetical protein
MAAAHFVDVWFAPSWRPTIAHRPSADGGARRRDRSGASIRRSRAVRRGVRIRVKARNT